MSIEVDLDQELVARESRSWLEQPRLVAVGAAAVAVVVIAVVAVTLQARRETPAVAVPPTAAASKSCPPDLPGAQPLPAFTITEAVAGDLYGYEDVGRWTVQLLVWIPSALADQPGLDLAELQTGSAEFPRLTVTTTGSGQIAVRGNDPKSMVVFEIRVTFEATAVYDTWASLRVSSVDVPSGDVVTVSLGGMTAEAVGGEALHASLSGFRLLFPGPEIKYGSPVFTTAC